MDGELTRQVRDLVQTMREKRQRLEETLEEVQVSLLRVLERHWKHIRPRAPRHPGS